MRRSLFLVASAFATCAVPALGAPQTCPIKGDAKQPLARTLNQYKNREDAPPVTKINTSATLTAVLAPGDDLTRWSRDNGAILEGVVVAVKVGGIESANCHAKDPAHRDTHIELALDSGAAETQRVIVEVTPRLREKMAVISDWSTSALRKELLGKRVRIIGWLFDDLEHKAQAENTNPSGAKNWRATVWEIHPITGIQVLPGTAAAIAFTAPSTTSPAPADYRARAKKKCTSSARPGCRTKSHAKHPTKG